MKILYPVIFLLFVAIYFTDCTSTGTRNNPTSTIDELDIIARGAIGRMEITPSDPLYKGDGGVNIRLAVLAPEVQGDVPDYLSLYIQGLLNNNINKFSAINLIDRQNLNRIIAEQNIATSGKFSDRDFISIGNLTNAQYFLFGTIQRLPENRYSLQLSITESSTGVRRANFMKVGTLTQLEGRGVIINEAVAELIEQLGVQLTETGKYTLLAGNISTVQAEAGLARGITAQTGGAEVEALFNYAQAITFNPSQLEALSRLNTLSTSISGGPISQRIMNDIQARDQWLEVFKETTSFFNNHPPFEIIFDPNLIQVEETDFKRRTVNLGMRIALDPSKAGFNALNTLLERLRKTGRHKEWGFEGWPLKDITPKASGTVLFNGKQSFNCKVDVALLNENNKILSTTNIILNTERMIFTSEDTTVMIPYGVEEIVSFSNVKVDDLTPSLTIAIVAVNGIRSRNLNTSGYMRIVTGELEKKEVIQPLGHLNNVISAVFNANGRQILSGSADNTIKLWDATTGHEIRTFSGHTITVNSVAFSPNGRQILSGSMDRTIKLWDITTGREIRTFSGHADRVLSVCFSPDGGQILSASADKTIKLWDTATGREIRTFSGHASVASTVSFSPDGRQILFGSADKTIKLWDTATGREIRTFSGHTSVVYTVSFSPDGRQILSGSADNTIKLWDATTGRETRTFSGHTGTISSVAFSPDGRQILSSSVDRTIKLWDIATGREIRTFSGFIGIFSIKFNPNGRHILISDDRIIKVLDIATGRVILKIGA
jgi:WD40 repeat protein